MNRVFETKSATLQHLACKERRDLPLELAEIKLAKDGEAVEFEGYASVWGRVDSYGDTVIKGAFTEALKERRPMMLFGHSPGRVPGKWVSYDEDDKGLKVRGQLTPGHSEASDIAASLKHGSLNGLSIGGFSKDWEAQKNGGRVIKVFDLFEVSIVSMPAEQEARIDTATVKAACESFTKLSEFEDFLCDTAGLSKRAATAVVSRFSGIVRGDPAPTPDKVKGAGVMLDAIRSLELPTLLGAQK